MNKAVIELQKQCCDSSVLCSDILQKAYLLAKQKKDKQFEEFCSLELQGYFGKSVPKYRQLSVVYKFRDLYYNCWSPILIEQNSVPNLFFDRPLDISIGEIETFFSANTDELQYPLPVEIQKIICNMAHYNFVEISAFAQKTQLAQVFQAVRKIILDWTFEIENTSVLGEDYMFPKTENISVTGNNNNIFNNLSKSHITINQGGIDFEKATQLMDLISNNIKNAGFTTNEQELVYGYIKEIHSAIAKKNNSIVQKMLIVIKNMCLNVTENLVASGIVQQISELLP